MIDGGSRGGRKAAFYFIVCFLSRPLFHQLFRWSVMAIRTILLFPLSIFHFSSHHPVFLFVCLFVLTVMKLGKPFPSLSPS